MVQVARLAPKLLESSTSLIVDFFHSQRREDGGFCDRDGRSDLYYTVFGIEGSLALQQNLPVDPLHGYVSAFGDGAQLDFVPLPCLPPSSSPLPSDMLRDPP